MAVPNATLVSWSAGWLILNRGIAYTEWYFLCVATIMGMVFADFVSGLLHWLFDTWFSELQPRLRRMVVMVREHHIQPLAIFKYRFYQDAAPLSMIAMLLTAPVLLPVVLSTGPASTARYCFAWACVIADLCIVFMLEFHKLGHRPMARGLLGQLQRCHLLLSPRHHSKHHRGRHDADYCIVNGLADHILGRVGFWPALEELISRLTGAIPRKNDDAWMKQYR